MDGPRAARAEDLPGIIELAEHVFCDLEGVPRYMARMFPLMLSEADLENLYLVADAGRPVSVIGIDLQTLVTCGCRIPCGLMGAVCTHEDHRGRGLAARTLRFAYERMRAGGVALIWISGRRGLYLSSGAAPVWPQYDAEVAVARLKTPPDGPALDVERITPATLPQMAGLQRRETVRFEWTEPWLSIVPPRLLGPGLGAGCLVRCAGRVVAAVCLREPRAPGGPAQLLDWFGDRDAVVAALAPVARDAGAARLACRLVSYNGRMVRLFEAAGFDVRRTQPSQRTMKVLNFGRLLDCLRPHLGRTLGDLAGAVAATDCGLRIALPGAEYATPDEATAARLLFALPDEYADRLAEMPAQVRDLVGRAFPVPLRHYGLNYI